MSTSSRSPKPGRLLVGLLVPLLAWAAEARGYCPQCGSTDLTPGEAR